MLVVVSFFKGGSMEPFVNSVLTRYSELPVSSKVLEDLLHVVFNIMCYSFSKPLYHLTEDVLESLGFEVIRDLHYVSVKFTGNKIHHEIDKTSLDIYEKYINGVGKLLSNNIGCIESVKFTKMTNAFCIGYKLCHIINEHSSNGEYVEKFVYYEELLDLQSQD